MTRGTEDVTKLPKWAQGKIARLERDLTYLEKKRQNNWSGEGETDTYIWNGLDNNIPLPHGANIVFEMGGKKGDCSIQVRVMDRRDRENGKVLEVMASGRNMHRLVIEPMSANVVSISNLDLDRLDLI